MLNLDNTQAKGYVLKALIELGYSREEINKIISNLEYQFDMMTEVEAEQYYNNN